MATNSLIGDPYGDCSRLDRVNLHKSDATASGSRFTMRDRMSWDFGLLLPSGQRLAWCGEGLRPLPLRVGLRLLRAASVPEAHCGQVRLRKGHLPLSEPRRASGPCGPARLWGRDLPSRLSQPDRGSQLTDHIPSNELKAEDVPSGGLAQFAYTFDGYQHLGSTDAALQRANEIQHHWVGTGALPEDVDDLRACLFVEYRRERFVEFDDVLRVTAPDGTVLHEPDPSTVTPARAEQERYKRALADRIADLLRRRNEH